jgi:hypothetical protein
VLRFSFWVAESAKSQGAETITAEVDGLIAVHKASGAPGVVRDINSPGIHAKTSFHYLRTGVTPSATGDEGTAVDWGGPKFPLSITESKQVVEVYRPYAERGQLAELYYGHSDYCVFRGKWQRWCDVPKPAGDLIRNAHYDHVHVAVAAGVFLRPPSIPTKQEALMVAIEPVTAVTNPSGAGGWVFGRQGHVYAFAGAAYFGGWTPGEPGPPNRSGRDCVALVPTATGRGYWLVSDAGEVYSYGDAQWPGNYQLAWGGGVIIGAFRNGRMPTIGGVSLVRDDGANLNVYALPA